MKAIRTSLRLSVFAIVAVLFLAGCTSMTQIQTIPSGAKIYVNDEFRGETPYTLADNNIIGTTSAIRLEKEGYQPFTTFITRSEEIDPAPVVCGLIFTPVWWLWAMKYRPVHAYELVPVER